MTNDNAAGWEALFLVLRHGDPCTRGISAERLAGIGEELRALERCADPARSAPARATLRLLACLVADATPDARLPDVVCQIANHPALPFELVREILRGERGGMGAETPAATLRQVARRLVAGATLEQAATAEGVAIQVAARVSRWLGVEEARTEALELAAADWVYAEAGSAAEFARRNGIGVGFAGSLIRDARVAAGLPASEHVQKREQRRREALAFAVHDTFWDAACG